MNDILNMMEEDFEKTLSSVETLDNDGLDTVAGLARKIKQQQEKVERLDRELKDEKQNLLKMTDEDLPSTMADLGLSKFSLDDGSTVEVKATYGASILVKNRPAAYEWLRDNGYDDIIKNVVSCQFGRGEDDQASAFQAFASQQGYPADQNESIHSQTLKAFVKERIEAGEDFPHDLFGAYVGQRAVIRGVK
ncbi:MAG: hypothetical protein CMC70_01405 [Flavobacteriaceae bacterium]|nr:hypothetical protein [Flavobacteriaceae bacterium]|tara:strand:+ start:218 stop:793 length:576 start_codon:yes stop_codon:yes gene_type:complete